ncbi:MAG: class I mannose-6-phosphate isomerase [Bacteroidales bacterium]|nr:class I mannose-6-phosphate isomerase [Bacteroidales bacterium]
MEQSLYPLKFLPLFKDKIWGGSKIKDIIGIDYSPLERCGELWVLSSIEGEETIVENGFLAESTLSEVIDMYMDELMGEKNYNEFGENFPLLFKIIDAKDKLSVQVHPDNKLAQQKGMDNGKTEMWYIMQADQGAEIISGFNKDMNKVETINRLRENTISEVLNVDKTEKGDLFFIPAGRIHAIGSGVMLAEIQQSSDATYRVYDWDRKDEEGNSRKLHIQEALEALDFKAVEGGKSAYDYQLNKTSELVSTPYFTTNVLHLTETIEKDYSQLDSFVVYLCVEGGGIIHTMGHKIPIIMGEAVLIPAIADNAVIQPLGLVSILETYIL